MNGRLGKLRKVDGYLRDLQLSDYPDVNFNYVTSQEDAAPRLQTLAGTQVLVARPEFRLGFSDPDTPRTTYIDTVFFVLEKDLDNGKTDQLECEQYDRCCMIAERILERFISDSGSCEYLCGMNITEVIVRPEVKVFGSWNGYSIAISLE